MEALKIINSYTEQLTQEGIVITSYYEIPSLDFVDCIPTEYQTQYPTFELIEVSTEPYPEITGYTENNL